MYFLLFFAVFIFIKSTVRALHTDFQVTSSERCEHAFTLKRFTTLEMASRFSLFKEALLVFEAQDSNVEQYTKVAAAFENANQCYHVILCEEKKRYCPDNTGS